MRKATILFDLDGTLIDSFNSILCSFKFAFEKNGFSCPEHNLIRSLIGFPLDDIFAKLGVKKENITQFIRDYKEYYLQIYLQETCFLPRAKEAIEFGFTFADLGIVTTKSSNSAVALLKYMDVFKYFKCIIGKDDVEFTKPNAEPIEKALKHMKKNKEDAFMIGDTILDILSAKNAKIIPIAVTCGYGDKNEFGKDNTLHVVENSYQAVDFIKKLLK